MAQWYVFENKVAIGPFDDGEMAQMSRSGRLDPKTPVRNGADGAWEKFGDLHVDFGATPTALPVATVVEERDGMLKFLCPVCFQRCSGDGAFYRGSRLECPGCGSSFMVPAAETEPWVPDELNEEIPDGELVCPHCWKSFPRDCLMYISSHPSLLGDPVTGQFEPKRFKPAVFNTVGQPLDSCGLPCTDMACPRCHLRIPSSVVDLPSHYFSIVGAPSSGKSYYLTALVHRLRRMLPENFAYSFFDVDPQLNAVIDTYESSIFMAVDPDKVATLPKTGQSGNDFANRVLLNQVPTDLPKPFIFELKSLSGAPRDAMTANMVFYDNAGEHFQPGADVLTNPATQHLACSDGIVFLFDPLNDAVMRRICNREDPQMKSSFKVTDQAVLLAEMINRIRRHRNMSALETCRIPLVIAVEKFDAWRDSFRKRPETLDLLEENGESVRAELKLDTILDVSFSLRELLLEFAPGLVNAAESFFERVYFVPVSNFGHPASRDDASGGIGIVPGKLDPIWVELPLLLLLGELGLLEYAAPLRQRTGEADFPVRELDGFLVFRHPVSGRKVRLPRNYLGAVLEIDGRKYAMPPRPPHATAKAAAHDLWN